MIYKVLGTGISHGRLGGDGRAWEKSLLVALALPGTADELRLKSGEVLHGTVTAFDGRQFTVQTAYGTLQVPRSDLATATLSGDAAEPAAVPPGVATVGPGETDSGEAPASLVPAWGMVPEGAAACWNLDGTAEDATGNHHGRIEGSPEPVADRHGQARAALRFAGRQGERVTVPHGPQLAPAELTVSAWVSAERPQRWARILDKLNCAAKSGYALFRHEKREVFCFQAFGEGSKEVWVESTSKVGPGWTHIAASYDSHIARLYVNGVLEDEERYDVPLRHNDKPLTLGGGFDGYNHFPWSGAIDAVRIYDRALSAAEIRALFEGQEGPLGSADLMGRDRI
jgi:hypothetical protein